MFFSFPTLSTTTKYINYLRKGILIAKWMGECGGEQ